ncbi:MAG TPA: M1 family metallopeptidase [Firmicutes bacterium]|nr:M1 family metallopeptidase [Bacillota bacterium]
MGFFRSRRWMFLLPVLALLFVFGWLGWHLQGGGVPEVIFPEPEIPPLADYTYPLYQLDLVLKPEEGTLEGTCFLKYTNNEGESLSELYFHLYPNAPLFSEGSRVKGSLVIEEVLLNKGPVPWKQEGTLLKVELPEPLPPGKETVLDLTFQVQVPPLGERFGTRKGIVSLGNWYPILAVYEDGAWRLDPYYEIGDPFYSDVALYRVTLRLPRRFCAAATGNLREVRKLPWWRKELYFETGPVRDFALTVSKNYQVARREVEGITVQSFYLRGQEEGGRLALEAACAALAFFQEVFGPYPYDQFSVAASGFFAGGMEYPNLVFISSELYRPGAEKMLEYVVVHETAHQWWYGLVGNDQIREPWLDEGLADFSSNLFYEFCRPGWQGKVPGSPVDLYELYQEGAAGGIIRRPLGEFASDLEYSLLVYGKGSMVFVELRKILGEEPFFQILKQYVSEYSFRHATIDDFIRLCARYTDVDLDQFFYKWLETA